MKCKSCLIHSFILDQPIEAASRLHKYFGRNYRNVFKKYLEFLTRIKRKVSNNIAFIRIISKYEIQTRLKTNIYILACLNISSIPT